MNARFLAVPLVVSALVFPSHAAEDRRARVLNDRAEVQADGYWIYNDFTQAVARAKQTGKPLLVVLRCVP